MKVIFFGKQQDSKLMEIKGVIIWCKTNEKLPNTMLGTPHAETRHPHGKVHNPHTETQAKLMQNQARLVPSILP